MLEDMIKPQPGGQAPQGGLRALDRRQVALPGVEQRRRRKLREIGIEEALVPPAMQCFMFRLSSDSLVLSYTEEKKSIKLVQPCLGCLSSNS